MFGRVKCKTKWRTAHAASGTKVDLRWMVHPSASSVRGWASRNATWPAGADVLLLFRGIECESAVARAHIEGRFLLHLAVLVDCDGRVHGHGGRAYVNPAHITSVDLVDLQRECACDCCSHRCGDDVHQMKLEQVPVVLARFVQRNVVGGQATDRTIVSNTDEERAPIAVVGERVDRLQGCCLQWLVHGTCVASCA